MPEAVSNTLQINEIFYSIQGESTHAGRPCVFVRLAFCNLRCIWCDSEYTFYEAYEQSFEHIFDEVRSHPCHLVEITGGEPLLQENVYPLMTGLLDAGYDVLLETSGSLSIRHVDPRVKRIVDFKCPGSKMAARNHWPNVEELGEGDEVKFVIQDRNDYEWAVQRINEYGLTERCPVLFSPVFGEISYRDLAEWILTDGLDVRFQVQLHKMIWDPEQRGV